MNFSSGGGQRGKLDKQTDRKCDKIREIAVRVLPSHVHPSEQTKTGQA